MIYITGFWDFSYSIKKFLKRYAWLLISLAAVFVIGIIWGVSAAAATPYEAAVGNGNYFLLRYIFDNRRLAYYLPLSLLFFCLSVLVIFALSRIIWLLPIVFVGCLIVGFRFAVPVVLLFRVGGFVTLPFLVVYSVFRLIYYFMLMCYACAIFGYMREFRRYGGKCDYRYQGAMSLCYLLIGIILIIVKCLTTHMLSSLISGVIL